MRAGIIGGGMIGAGWARLLRAHGHEAVIYDERPEHSEAASVEAAVHRADVVFEAVVERLAAKCEVLKQIEAAARENALIASASSSILPTLMQAGMSRPERFCVIHPLHPVDLLPVIEVVPGAVTAPAAVERAAALVTALGKQPVILKQEVPGYVVNRLAGALWREAINLVHAGVVDVAQVDLAASQGPCLGWAVQGPFLTYQLAAPGGLGPFMAHLAPAFTSIWASLAAWDRLPPGALERLSAAANQAYPPEQRGGLEAARDRRLKAVLAELQQA